MKDFESMKDYFSRVIDVVNHMKTSGENITDQRIIEKILISLPEKYEYIVAAIEESRDLSTLSMQQLMSSLLSHEQRRLRNNDQFVKNALQSNLNLKSQPFSKKKDVVSDSKRSDSAKEDNSSKREERNNQGKAFNNSRPPCKICKKTDHDTSKSWHRGKPKCYHCKKWHVEKNCKFKANNHANFSEEQNDDNVNLFYASQAITDVKDNIWYLDSGCSNNMSRNNKIFLDIETTVRSKVKLGNGFIVESKGKGTILIETKRGPRYIRDVLLVSDLEQNLLSIRQLVENSYHVCFENNACKIFDRKNKDQVIASSKMRSNRSFPLEFLWSYAF
ncbi:hypothetical protein EZV62_015682 [Acer yangbiense]|uniref:Retrovirus-related Pol polyprotein from transposon TNT 1-94-like beta-barrel domain-containing protein n=1 Tax=Acer yangbiense TaxID=1000413 RepID=A0A5C7HLJ1_9ROSI|nr:hypothetical protein EZV62_015682 [Acer yangbiense]